jgi:hypothetical protein
MIPYTPRTAPPPFPAHAAPPPEEAEPELRPSPPIYSADASPTSSSPLVSSLRPPPRFGAIPVEFGARGAILGFLLASPATGTAMRRRAPPRPPPPAAANRLRPLDMNPTA